MSELRLAEGLALPPDAAVHRLAFIGTTNSGKTYTATKLAERMWDAGVHFVALDVMGIWHGMRLARNGVDPGVPITIFGGPHGDLPITENDGATVAEIVHDTGISAIVDISEFEHDAEKIRFATRFAERLYRLRKADPGAMHLFLEEAHEFLPQETQSGEARMLHVWNRLWKQGGNFGIGGSLITQRPQDVNKKALDLSACVFAHNTTGTNAVKAMRAWIGAEETAGLRELAQGECIVWSPSWLRVNARFRIEPKRTFHARFDPLAAIEARPAERTLAVVDVEALRSRFADAAAAVADSDPETLRKELERLRAKLAEKGPNPEDLERAFRAGVMHALRQFDLRLEQLKSDVGSWLGSGGYSMPASIDEALDEHGHLTESQPPAPAPRLAEERPKAQEAAPAAHPQRYTGPQYRILSALAELEAAGVKRPTKAVVAAFADASPTSSAFANNLGRLRTLGAIEYPSGGLVALTELGREDAPRVERPATLSELHDRWRKLLSGPQARILDALIETYPHPAARDLLAARVGASDSSSAYANNLGRMRTLGLIDYPQPGRVMATDLLFPEGLR